eukprot:g14986.t2
MKAATALAQASPDGGAAGTGTQLPRHWGGPPELPRAKVSEPLAVMATEAALEDFRRGREGEGRRGHSGGRGRCNQHDPGRRQQRSGASTSTSTTRRARLLQQRGGLVLVGEDGIRKSKFPRGCERGRARGFEEGGGRQLGVACEQSNIINSGSGGGGKEDVLTRLCNPKNFTGTAATGHLPTVVDLEGGVGVLLKGDSTALKDHIGAEEVSWRLRLAERL